MNIIEQAREEIEMLKGLVGRNAAKRIGATMEALIAEIASIKTGQEPYAIEAGFDNGDGTYSVYIERFPFARPTHKDWAAHEKLLYLAAGAQPLTPAMITAGQHAWMTADGVDPARVYHAMLAAAGAQPATAGYTFEDARRDGVFKPAHDVCPTWYATALRKEGWDAAMAAKEQS